MIIDGRFITTELYYYDEKTPNDYEPPCFKAATQPRYSFMGNPSEIDMGSVDTPFHW